MLNVVSLIGAPASAGRIEVESGSQRNNHFHLPGAIARHAPERRIILMPDQEQIRHESKA
ncbi:hypothetical protein [Desulfonatronum parangueonense]